MVPSEWLWSEQSLLFYDSWSERTHAGPSSEVLVCRPGSFVSDVQEENRSDCSLTDEHKVKTLSLLVKQLLRLTTAWCVLRLQTTPTRPPIVWDGWTSSSSCRNDCQRTLLLLPDVVNFITSRHNCSQLSMSLLQWTLTLVTITNSRRLKSLFYNTLKRRVKNVFAPSRRETPVLQTTDWPGLWSFGQFRAPTSKMIPPGNNSAKKVPLSPYVKVKRYNKLIITNPPLTNLTRLMLSLFH